MKQKNGMKIDLRVIKTHRALNAAFLRLLETTDLESISVNDLCREADIRRATFYKHFSGKSEFIASAIRQMHRNFTTAAETMPDTASLETFLLEYARQTLKFLHENEMLLRRVQGSNMLPTLLNILLEEALVCIRCRLKAEAENGVSLPASPEVLASFYVGGLYQLLFWRLENTPSMTDDELLQDVARILRRLS